MQQVNLYQSEFHPKKDHLNFHQFSFIVVCVLGIFVALGLWLDAENKIINMQLVQEQQLLDPLRNQSSELAKIATDNPDDAQLDRQIISMQNEIRNKSVALNTLKNSDISAGSGFSDLLTALAQPKSNRIWFNQILLEQDVLVLNGQTMSPSLITDWIESTSRFKELNRQFATVSISRNENDKRVYDFQLSGGVAVND